MIADNRLTEIGTWDDRLLAEQLRDLSLLGLDFSIELTGFEMGEIDLRILSLDDATEPDNDPADTVLDTPVGPPVSKNRRCVGPRSPPSVMRECARHLGLYGADRRRARRGGVHRPALQRTDRRSCERSRRDPSSALSDGVGRDGPIRVHRLSRPGVSQPRGISAPMER